MTWFVQFHHAVVVCNTAKPRNYVQTDDMLPESAGITLPGSLFGVRGRVFVPYANIVSVTTLEAQDGPGEGKTGTGGGSPSQGSEQQAQPEGTPVRKAATIRDRRK